jgi:CheY-like chemotaxis protein
MQFATVISSGRLIESNRSAGMGIACNSRVRRTNQGNGNWMNPHCTVLLVDDDEDDAFVVRRALEKLGFDGMFRRVADANNARAYLEGKAPFEDREYNPAPQLVLSDSHLGTCTGLELLKWTRGEASLRDVPFVLFSSSLSPDDAKAALENGATAYFVKPAAFEETIAQVREIVSHMPEECRPWLKTK